MSFTEQPKANPMEHLSAQQIADHVGKTMWEQDSATQAQQMQLESIGPGTATLRMTVLDHMVNGHRICHGGFIFCWQTRRLLLRVTVTDSALLRLARQLTFSRRYVWATHSGQPVKWCNRVSVLAFTTLR